MMGAKESLAVKIAFGGILLRAMCKLSGLNFIKLEFRVGASFALHDQYFDALCVQLPAEKKWAPLRIALPNVVYRYLYKHAI